MGLNEREKRSLNVMEITCFRRIRGVTIRGRIRKEEIRRKFGVLSDQSGRFEKYVLRWLGHVERMYRERMAKNI